MLGEKGMVVGLPQITIKEEVCEICMKGYDIYMKFLKGEADTS